MLPGVPFKHKLSGSLTARPGCAWALDKHELPFAPFALLAAVAALALGANAYAAKEIKIAANNSGYSADDAQKLASTALSMGVKEPVNLSLAGGNLTVSGSSAISTISSAPEMMMRHGGAWRFSLSTQARPRSPKKPKAL